MAKPFDELRERLLLAGVAPRHVRRYLAELGDHLADLTEEGERAGLSRSDAATQALLRLGDVDHLARAMTRRPQLQSWSVRSPWAIFGIAPLVTLAASYLIASLILWSGWKIFFPGKETPFVRVDGLEILYFGVGWSLYTFAPIMIGWTIGLVAARQRFHLMWPTIGVVLVALVGGTAKVHAHRSIFNGETRHVSISLALGPPVHGIPDGLAQALMILSASVLPYLIWRFHKRRPLMSA